MEIVELRLPTAVSFQHKPTSVELAVGGGAAAPHHPGGLCHRAGGELAEVIDDQTSVVGRDSCQVFVPLFFARSLSAGL